MCGDVGAGSRATCSARPRLRPARHGVVGAPVARGVVLWARLSRAVRGWRPGRGPGGGPGGEGAGCGRYVQGGWSLVRRGLPPIFWEDVRRRCQSGDGWSHAESGYTPGEASRCPRGRRTAREMGHEAKEREAGPKEARARCDRQCRVILVQSGREALI